MTASSSKVAGTATRFTGALLAPRIFGGARSISSSSSAACISERSSRYAAALVDSVDASSDARQALISERVTSRSGISPK